MTHAIPPKHLIRLAACQSNNNFDHNKYISSRASLTSHQKENKTKPSPPTQSLSLSTIVKSFIVPSSIDTISRLYITIHNGAFHCKQVSLDLIVS